MTEQVITPDTAPSGRYILRADRFGAQPYEVEIVEWSPSGKRARLKHVSGALCWIEPIYGPLLVEALATTKEQS